MASTGAPQPRVAVIGSGLAGLTTAWLLGQTQQDRPAAHVELFEAAPSLGMGTHSVELRSSTQGKGTADSRTIVDIPPRFVVPSYYTELLRLYESIGIPFYMSTGDGCFQTLGSGNSPYFRFGNFRVFGVSLPYVLAMPWSSVARRIVWDLLRFRWLARRHLRAGALIGRTFGEYLDEEYSVEFGARFAVPMLCVVCTCSPAAVRAYPADTLVEYWLCWALRGDGLRRADGGTHAVVAALSQQLAECHLGTRVTAVVPGGSSPSAGPLSVVDDKGIERTFDHVVFATQAKYAADLLEGYLEACSNERRKHTALTGAAEALRSVSSEAAEMVLHGDSRAMPSARRSWAAMNVFVSADYEQVMCTAWQPRIEARAGIKSDHVYCHPTTPTAPLLQTWNPISDENDKFSLAEGDKNPTVVARSWFERPIVTLETPGHLQKLSGAQGVHNLWFAGSYSLPGVPLLENAVRSGLLAAEGIVPGLRRPWAGRTKPSTQTGAAVPIFADSADRELWQRVHGTGNCVLGSAAALEDAGILALSFCPLMVLAIALLLPTSFYIVTDILNLHSAVARPL